jgi:hypothetical protein
MKTLTPAARLIAFAAAGILTSALFSTVIALAEPGHGALIDKATTQPQAAAATFTGFTRASRPAA